MDRLLIILVCCLTYQHACETTVSIDNLPFFGAKSHQQLESGTNEETSDDPPFPIKQPPICPSSPPIQLAYKEQRNSQFNSLTKCLLGDNPAPDNGAIMCETWSINIVVALRADSTVADLNNIKTFVRTINTFCDSRTMLSVFAPGLRNEKCTSLPVTNLTEFTELDQFIVANRDDTYATIKELYHTQLMCSQQDVSQLGGLTVVFTNSDCEDYCTYTNRTEHPPYLNPSWTQLYYSGVWDDSCETDARSVFDFLDCEDNVGKCKFTEMPLSNLKEEYSCMRTCKNPDVLDAGKLLLIIGIPCVTMIVIALGCAYFCYKKSNIRWRKFFLREQLQKHNLTAQEIKELEHPCNPPSAEVLAKLSMAPRKDTMLTSPSRKLNHYSDFFRGTIDEDPCRWEIGNGNLLILENKVLGHGAFATVCKGVISGRIPLLDVYPTLSLNCKHGDEIEVAVKRMPNHADEFARADFYKEIEFMKTLGYHRHIVSMFGAVTTSIDPILVVEFCYHGDLLRFLRSRNKHVLEDENEDCPVDAEICLRVKDLVSIAWQVADGMSYLSSLNFIHRDLAARNVLLTQSLVAKISDFGLGRRVDSTLYMAKGGRLPLKWMPPESLKFNEFSQKSDMWSFGIVLYELFSLGKQPFPLVQPFEMVEHLEAGGRPPQPALCPKPVFDVQTWALAQLPDQRPTFEEAKDAFSDLLNTNDEKYGYLDLAGQHSDSSTHDLMNNIAEPAKGESIEIPSSPSQEVEWLYIDDGRRSDPDRKRSASASIQPSRPSSPTLSYTTPPFLRAVSTSLFERRKEFLRQSAIEFDSSDLPPFSPPPPPPPSIHLIAPTPRSGSAASDVKAPSIISHDIEKCPHHYEQPVFEPPPPYSESWPASHGCDRTLEEGLEGIGSVMP